jgi:transcription initiation factor TFIIIB Brf1 subunit/transcription initiation factor TFIIB|tara:strand:- start:365 stop:754 length:390 start_codon:yes stop_codon:yes gene_type:complete
MTKGCKNFTEIMRMSNCDKGRLQAHKSVNLFDFIDRFCHKLKLLETDIRHIKHISKICEELSLINDNTPPAMSSGCIYLYTKRLDLGISKKYISETCKISEVTINKCAKKIENIPELNEYFTEIIKDKS